MEIAVGEIERGAVANHVPLSPMPTSPVRTTSKYQQLVNTYSNR
jgi:hypothetical protein